MISEQEALLAYLGLPVEAPAARQQVDAGKASLKLIEELLRNGNILGEREVRRARQVLAATTSNAEPVWLNPCKHEGSGLPGCDICDGNKEAVRAEVLKYLTEHGFAVAPVSENIVGNVTQELWDEHGCSDARQARRAMMRLYLRWDAERLDYTRRPPWTLTCRMGGIYDPHRPGRPAITLAEAWLLHKEMHDPPGIKLVEHKRKVRLEIGPVDVDTEFLWLQRKEARKDAWRRYDRRRRFPARFLSPEPCRIAHIWAKILEMSDKAVKELEEWFAPVSEEIRRQAGCDRDDPTLSLVEMSVDSWYLSQEQWDAMVTLPSWKHLFSEPVISS